MTREALIAKVKNKYAAADPATIEAVLAALQETKFEWRLPEPAPAVDGATREKTAVSSPPLKFVGEHLSLEEYRKLSMDERCELKRRLQEQNRQWLEEKFADLRAAWIMVLDGEVIAAGQRMLDYPRVEKIREIGSRFGKRPFIFVNDLVVAIEESRSNWRGTIYEQDFYPTVPITLHNDSGEVEVIADFDTGAASSFVNYDLLHSLGMIPVHVDEEGQRAEHLGQNFKYINIDIDIDVQLPQGKILSRELSILGVFDWKASPFIRINPHRTALAGRDLFLELKPSITLDFANCRTTLAASEPA